MRILDIRETTVSLSGAMRNAAVGFGGMTASAVVLVSDLVRGGKPLVGLAFDSIGRYGHGALLRERFIPRVLAADPQDYAAAAGDALDPLRLWEVVMRDEKPGGHGERAGAVGLLDAAAWDLQAKASDVPLWRLLGQRFGNGQAETRVPVYASGGHYRDGDDLGALRRELRGYLDRGYTRAKIKIGADLSRDQARIEAALSVVGGGAALAVDANGIFDRARAAAYLAMLAPYGLAWLEEPVDPLDFEGLASVCRAAAMPVATGENLFSAADVRNLLRYGGLRPERDLLQMDISLSYGLPEYLRMLALVEAAGWSRRSCVPHAGHVLALNAAAGIGLGGCEAAPGAAVFGDFPDGVRVDGGFASLPEHPGAGIERTPGLYAVFRDLL